MEILNLASNKLDCELRRQCAQLRRQSMASRPISPCTSWRCTGTVNTLPFSSRTVLVRQSSTHLNTCLMADGPVFTRDMANGGPYFSRLLLNAIYFSVSKFSNRVEVYDDPAVQTTAGNRFLRRVKQLLGEALDQSTIPTIQAMLLLSSSMFALGHQSAAWLYHGIAIQMIFDLGTS